jgi:hypothetical protein
MGYTVEDHENYRRKVGAEERRAEQERCEQVDKNPWRRTV